jgi:ABC-type lipoprotein release transport system permease subunit
MIWSLAWKNIWRNKLRSIIVMIAVALGVFAGIFTTAFMNGMVDDRVNSVIRTEVSHIQVHKPGFEDNNDLFMWMDDADSLLGIIREVKGVAAASKRIIITSMVASAEMSTGVRIIGIEPESEKNVTNISSKMLVGGYFEGNARNPVVIGKKLAEELKVGIRNKIIITVQDVNKTITAGAFRVAGIFRTGNDMFDKANIFVRYDDLCRLTELTGSEAHEIAVLVGGNENVGRVCSILKEDLPDLDVKDWMQLSPEAGYLVSAMDQYMYVLIIVILLALCFSIINTMLMAVLERARELGMLLAVGMGKSKVLRMIILETIYLSLTGGLVGVAGGYFICRYLGKVGMNLYFWKEAYESIGYSSIIYPKISFMLLIYTTLMVILTGLMASLYPAYKAVKLNPAEATRV